MYIKHIYIYIYIYIKIGKEILMFGNIEIKKDKCYCQTRGCFLAY